MSSVLFTKFGGVSYRSSKSLFQCIVPRLGQITKDQSPRYFHNSSKLYTRLSLLKIAKGSHIGIASQAGVISKSPIGGIYSRRTLSIKEENNDKDSKIATNKEHSRDLEYMSNSANFKLSERKDDSQSGYPDVDSLKKLFRLAIPETKLLLIAFFCLLISSTISMLLPMIIGKLLDTNNAKNDTDAAFTDSTGSEENDGWLKNFMSSFQSKGNLVDKDVENIRIFGLPLNVFFVTLGTVFLIGALANGTRIVLLKTIGERVIARLRVRILKKSLEQDAVFLDYNKVGDLISRLTNDSFIITRSVTQNLSDGIRAVISGVVGLSMMCLVSLKLTGYLMLLGPPLAIGAAVYGKKVRNISRKLQEEVGSLTKVAEESLSSTKTIQSFNGEVTEIHNFSKQVRRVFDVGFLDAKYTGLFFGTTGFIGNCALLLLLSVGTSMVRNGEITVGDLTSFMMYAVYTGSSMFGVSNFYSELMKGLGAASRVFELNDRKPLIHSTTGRKIDSSKLRAEISFDNIKFFYPTRPNSVIFNELDFTIKSGEHVCIVGPSGSGKSTIMHLLLRFYDPATGAVKLDGVDIREYNLKNFRRIIGVVQQEPLLFSGTIEENIKYGYLNATKEEVDRVVELSNCNKFLSSFPNGLQTVIGPKGAQLSGGQKQRIALARALILRPKILILDEATSALDSESENAITKTINKRNIEGLTTISIAHRISTIKSATRIIVLKNKKMVETGTFNELFNDENSFLYELLSAQGASPVQDAANGTGQSPRETEDNEHETPRQSAIIHDDREIEAELLEKELVDLKKELARLRSTANKSIENIEESLENLKR
ncbi:ATP-binding cassette permease [Saccharomycopsis crataegensis]|uniref:ATP-binding cassette permease n=1 Tax=Saccharomycopsis crataegensis TaxID=43959 RepID=A0AAV5QM49_9ASCO|nr:ATP-binding cassette permease [Saccharomycopsis crataegensis]